MAETFQPTTRFRWYSYDRDMKPSPFHTGPVMQDVEGFFAYYVLQQAWEGDQGSVRWEDVPIEVVDEEKEDNA